MTNRSIASLLSFSIATLASLAPLRAADFTSPEWAGDSGASISVWESFTNALGEPGNPPETINNSAGGSVLQSAPGATVTGSGNIYNPAGASSFSLIHESTTTYKTLSLQTKIIGAIDPDSVALDYQIDGELVSLPAEMIEVSRESGGFGDTIVNQWTWDLETLSLSSVVLRFGSTGAHASLDAVRLDVLSTVGPKPLMFVLPSWTAQENTTYAEWLNFTEAFGEPGNRPDIDGSNPESRLIQSVPGASVTGSGNIYNPAAASEFFITDQSESTFEEISFQSKIIDEIDPESVRLELETNGITRSLTAEMIEVGRESGGFGDTVINRWHWDLSDVGANNVTIHFAATGPHASLVSARIDALSKPNPVALIFRNPDWSEHPQAKQSEWLHFSSAFGPDGNAPDVEGSNGGGILVQEVPGALVTGSGNIYNPAGASSFALNVSDDHAYDQISVQAKITGGIATDSVALSYTDNEIVKTLATETVEVGRESGPQGDTIIYHWAWDTTDLDVREFVIRFNAVAPHSSLVSVRLNTLQQQRDGGEAITANFTEPLHDRWNYPFNATPGTRARASLFRAVDPEQGVDRHGTFIVVFDTSEQIPLGRPEADYKIVSAQLRVLTSDNFEVPYDPSPDSITSHLPVEHSDRTADNDPGRPIHVFGAGFRHGLDASTWNEKSPYSPENETERSIFPAIVDESGGIVDVTLAVDYADPKEAVPFATGSLSETAPGDLIPSDTWMQFEVDLSAASTMKYLQQNLSQGALAFTLTSLNGGGQGIRTFPEFHTSDSLIGEAPQLTLSVELEDSAVTTEPPIITGIQTDEAGIHIGINAKGASQLGIRWTQDFINWTEVDNPIFATEADGSLSWTDTNVTDSKFYQITHRP